MTETAAAPAPTSAAGLVRAVGRWSLVALVLNSMIGSGVFGVPSLVARTLGAAGPLTYLIGVLIAGAGIGVIMACFAEVSSRFTEAGGPYLYARTAFGRFVGIEMGWLAWLVRISSAGATSSLFVLYLAEFWPGATKPGARVLVLTLLIGLLAAVNYRGVRAGATVSNVLIVAKLTPLIIFAVAGGVYLGLHGAVPIPAAAPVGPSRWLEALLILTFLYGGFEAGLMPLGEARNPRRDAPFAVLTALVVGTVLFSLVHVIVAGVLPAPAATDRPLATAARVFLGPGGAVLITVGALLSVYGWVSGMTLNAPRLTYALAERGDFPWWFAKVHPRFQTPHVSIVAFAVLAWALAVWGDFRWNVVLSSVARLVTYGLVCASLPVLRRRPGEALFRLPAGTVFAVLGILFAGVLLARVGRSEFYALGITVALAWVNWLWARKTNRRDAEPQRSIE